MIRYLPESQLNSYSGGMPPMAMRSQNPHGHRQPSVSGTYGRYILPKNMIYYNRAMPMLQKLFLHVLKLRVFKKYGPTTRSKFEG
jgi:hypothetical protein